MHRRFCRNVACLLTAAAAVTGCTTPHHSNALIFGTNTSFGIDVGQTPTGVPSIVVGYRRQEAVFMPLVATEMFDANGIPTPCAIYPRILSGDLTRVHFTNTNGERVPPPCFLVGQNGGAFDSYSVLASFGAEFSARATQPEASGGLAQFFATGLAAQALAIRGGSSLVAISEASESAATADTDAAIGALYSAPAVTQRITQINATGFTAHAAVVAYLRAHTTDQNFGQELVLLENAANRSGLLSYYLCDGLNRQGCMAAIEAEGGRNTITAGGGDWATAIERRKQARGIQ